MSALVASPDAQALTSNCSDENGDCTVSNLPDDVDCSCGGGGFGSTGGDDWDMLNQAELDAVCLEQLADCALFGGTTFGGTTFGGTTFGSDSATTFGDGSEVGPGTTFGSDVTTDPTVGTISVGTDGTDSVGDSTGTAGGTSTAGDDSTTTADSFTLTSGSSGDDTTGGDDTDGGASMSGASMSSATSPDPTNGAEDSSGEGSAGDDILTESGCGCRSTGQSPAFAALGFLGLIFARRRRA